MSLKQNQKQVDEWIANFKLGYFKPLEILARLTEETGELAREINHRWGPKKKKDTEDLKDLEDEIADILYTLICLANSQNIDLDKAWDNMMNKLYTRDKDRYERK
ncbi:MAG: nucleotide pyrophosphohydrolase [Patescibacteria group bacterium]